MVDRPDPRCLPLEVEGISLHREPRRAARRPRLRPASSRRLLIRVRLAAAVMGRAHE
jgi:hypothetical protein